MNRTGKSSLRGPAVLVAAAAVAAPGVAGADDVDPDDDTHCVIEVIGVEESGELIAAEPVCYETLSEALQSSGLDEGDLDPDEGPSEQLTALASGVIGIHWDGANRTGSSITVSGADCAGGYLNLSSAWINRISSTRNYCSAVVFWDGFDKTGSWEQTGLSSMNLGALNNASNSISYGS